MNRNLEIIKEISNRLAIALSFLVAIAMIGAAATYFIFPGFVTAPMAAFFAGMIGGFVGLQRRLKGMGVDDLELLANSWVYVWLSPLVGGVLAVVLYVLFLSGLLSGDLFPLFRPDCLCVGDPAAANFGVIEDEPCCCEVNRTKRFVEVFKIHGYAMDYAKMLFWAFVAGFSERFVTDIISKFESSSGAGNGKDN